MEQFFFATDGKNWYLLPINLKETWDRIGNHPHRHEFDAGRIIENHQVKGSISQYIFTRPVIQTGSNLDENNDDLSKYLS